MKPALITVLFAAMGLLIVVFILNVRLGKPPIYYGGSLTPVDPDPPADPILARLIPSEVTHSCPTCGPCVHPVEITVNRRTLTLTDHHRWFQLFNAADRTWYFDDPVQLAGCLKNRSALDPRGEWKIQARLGPARHAVSVPHPCGEIPLILDVRYDLVRSKAPIEDSMSDFSAPFRIADSVSAMVYRYDDPRLPTTLYFGWELETHALTGFARSGPCPCGKP
jgi:hypothetical protein